MSNEPASQGDKPRRGIYLLPNTITSIALFCGFFGIVQAINGLFLNASIAIFIAMLFDSLDGRLARLTKSTSEFGAEYDSLSDMVSFGAAPALIMYQWNLSTLGKWGWVAAFVYCVAAALRLARFNVNTSIVDKRFFQGLPSPAAAAITMGFLWMVSDQQISPKNLEWISFGIMLYAGLMMVSNVPFFSFKTLGYKKNVPFLNFFLIILLIIVIFLDPPLMIFSIFVIYALSGPALWVIFKIRKKPLITTSKE